MRHARASAIFTVCCLVFASTVWADDQTPPNETAALFAAPQNQPAADVPDQPTGITIGGDRGPEESGLDSDDMPPVPGAEPNAVPTPLAAIAGIALLAWAACRRSDG